jgi:hypothetical protein
MTSMTSMLYGYVAEFDSPESLVKAIHSVRRAGYRRFDAYTPFPVEEVTEAMELHGTGLPPIVLAGGLLGGLAGFSLQYYLSAVAYPLNIAGRPLNSWPAFIPATFELAILGAAFAAVLGMLALNGLPMPYHPLFNVDRFALASRNRFFLSIESRDPLFDPSKTRDLLRQLSVFEVMEVER